MRSRLCWIGGASLGIGCTLAGCKNSLIDRSLIFATHTTAGIEISVNPTEAAAGPVTLVMGYRRFEGVMNPVFYNHDAATSGSAPEGTSVASLGVLDDAPVSRLRSHREVEDYYLPEAYSVLATFDGNAKASAGNQAEASGAIMQVFATGAAAKIAAANPDAIRALSGAPTKDGTKELSPAARRSVLLAFSSLYTHLANSTDADDLRMKAILDSSAVPSRTTQASTPRYQIDVGNALSTMPWTWPVRDWSQVVQVWQETAESVRALSQALTDSTVDTSEYDRNTLLSHFNDQALRSAQMLQQLLDDPAFKQAREFLATGK